jgi:catechol 2,3-dioxygenase-like lactoylglutathione lyase family enzyme
VDALIEARRFLHCCLCCPSADDTARLMTDAFGLQVTMQTSPGKTDGRILGLPGDMEADTRFAYDARGPRVSPAIEIQEWIDPPLVGEAYPEPNHVGLHAIGIAVGSLDGALERATAFGVTVVGRTEQSALLRGGDGVAIDVVERDELGVQDTRMHHLRATCADLERSIAWYTALGFVVVERDDDAVAPAALWGIPDDGRLSAVRLRLPDEPFSLLLQQWREPSSFGEPYATANHRGMYRTAICVDDTRAAHQLLLDEGWIFDAAPEQVELQGTPVPDMWIAFLRDPDGLPLEFVERPRSAFLRLAR